MRAHHAGEGNLEYLSCRGGCGRRALERREAMSRTVMEREEKPVRVAAGAVTVEGNLVLPEGATGIVLFAHGSGSSRLSSRNRSVADELARRGLGTLLIDLLTAEEEDVDLETPHLRFDIG